MKLSAISFRESDSRVAYEVSKSQYYILTSNSSSAWISPDNPIASRPPSDKRGKKNNTELYLRIREYRSSRLPFSSAFSRDAKRIDLKSDDCGAHYTGRCSHGRREESHSVAWNEKFEFRAVAEKKHRVVERKKETRCPARGFLPTKSTRDITSFVELASRSNIPQ